MTDVMTLAVVEDDPEIRTLLGTLLEAEGFRVRCVDDAAGLDHLLAREPAIDLVVLDWMLPGEDGLSVCRRIRAVGGPAVIMVTARDCDTDRVAGLDLGADDYISKPFNPRVLLARIRAVLRRTRGAPGGGGAAASSLRVADLVIDPGGRRVAAGEEGREVVLTGAEFDLLMCFVARPQRVLSRDQLLDWTRGRMADPFDRTIDVQVSRLRRKLAESGSSVAAQLKTVRTAGYILAAPVVAA